MKRILFIIWSHSLGGGAESLLTTIVNHLNPQKYQIGIMEVYHSTVKKEPLNANIKVYEPVTFEGDREYRKKMYYMHRDQDRVIRRYIPSGYDLYVSFNYQIPSFLLPKGTGNIAWIHTSVDDLAEEGMEEYRALQNRAFGNVAKIVSISDITTKSIQTLFPEYSDKLVEIYNSVNVEDVRKRAECRTEIRLKQPAVIWVGRLEDRKNPLRMVDIFQRVHQENSQVHLYFMGKGELETPILDKSSGYGLQEHVHVLGYLDNPFPVIKQANICCMTSEAEGFPMSLLECVALDVPFVSTEIGGARILANEERCGRIFSRDDEAAKDILALLNQPAECLKEECARSIRRFDLGVYISRIELLFDEVLRQKRDTRNELVQDTRREDAVLEDRDYYYRFPENLIPRGARIILYGAGDVGTNFYYYIKETNVCKIAAWVDAAAEKYRALGRDVQDIDVIWTAEYDAVLISVMQSDAVQEIRSTLHRRGIPDDRILWTKPIF